MSGIAFEIYASVSPGIATSSDIMSLHPTETKSWKYPTAVFLRIFSLFFSFSFISATGDRQEETELMETDVSQEECLPSEATSGKSDSDMFEFICHVM